MNVEANYYVIKMENTRGESFDIHQLPLIYPYRIVRFVDTLHKYFKDDYKIRGIIVLNQDEYHNMRLNILVKDYLDMNEDYSNQNLSQNKYMLKDMIIDKGNQICNKVKRMISRDIEVTNEIAIQLFNIMEA